MSFTDILAGDIAPELLRLLVLVATTVYGCKGIAERLITLIRDVQPTIREIQYSGVELSQHRQTQLRIFFEILEKARKLSEKVLRCKRYNPKHIYHANKMKDLERKITRFLSTSVLVNILADVNSARFICEAGIERVEKKCDSLIDRMDSLSLAEAMKRAEATVEIETEVDPGIQREGLDLGKRQMKEMMSRFLDAPLFGISGMGGSGKTTLAQEILRDDGVRGLFENRVLFLTVSRSPNIEKLRFLIKEFLDDRVKGRKLVILDDVWTRDSLDKLMFKIAGSTTLVVSRSKLADPKTTYNVELLKEDEAMSLFCISAFGDKSIPSPFCEKLVKQVVDECKGLPLSLKVLGALLKDKPERYWEGVVKKLSRGETVDETHESRVFAHIEESLKTLDPRARKCFLDLGAFPEDKKIPLEVVTNIWVELHYLDEETAFAILVDLSDKNLLTLVKNPRLGALYTGYYDIYVKQHDVLRDVAIYVSNKVEINRRERLLMPRREPTLPREWEGNNNQPFDARIVSIHTEEMSELNWFDMELPETQVLILNFSSDNYTMPPFIGKMGNLRALVVINNSKFPAFLHGFPLSTNLTKLRSLWLERVHVPELFSSTVPLRNLQKMHLILCKINNSFDQTDDTNIFPSLSDLTIDHCDDLVKLPSTICGMSTLNSISITNCPRILELPKNLSKLQSLELLRLYACLELEALPLEVCELPCLKYLDISQCVSMESLPQEIGKLRTLEKIDMRECGVSSLPGSVVALKSLRHVICNEEALSMWEEVKKVVSGLCIEAAEKNFSLDWLDE